MIENGLGETRHLRLVAMRLKLANLDIIILACGCFALCDNWTLGLETIHSSCFRISAHPPKLASLFRKRGVPALESPVVSFVRQPIFSFAILIDMVQHVDDKIQLWNCGCNSITRPSLWRPLTPRMSFRPAWD